MRGRFFQVPVHTFGYPALKLLLEFADKRLPDGLIFDPFPLDANGLLHSRGYVKLQSEIHTGIDEVEGHVSAAAEGTGKEAAHINRIHINFM